MTIPSQFEYLALIFLGFLLGSLLFGSRVRQIAMKARTWAGLLVYIFFCSSFDILGLRQGWFYFDQAKVVGLNLAGVPIEEYFLFVGIYLFTVAAWEGLYDVA